MHKDGLKKRQKNNAGFTLVELIVVLVILAMLAAILAPALLGYIDQARRESEIANARAVMNAVEAKLSLLYDQGLMPNVDFHDDGNQSTHSSGFSWKKDWSEDVMYASGIKVDPHICGFACGQLCSTRPNNYLNQGLSGLKKGYQVYVFFYMEEANSRPVFFYNGEWTDSIPVIGSNGAFTPAGESEPVYLSSWYVPLGCEGSVFNAARTWSEVTQAAKQ